MIRNTFIIEVDIDLDLNFIALLPAININLYSRSLEFEWLMLGVYISFSKPATYSREFSELIDSVESKIANL